MSTEYLLLTVSADPRTEPQKELYLIEHSMRFDLRLFDQVADLDIPLVVNLTEEQLLQLTQKFVRVLSYFADDEQLLLGKLKEAMYATNLPAVECCSGS